MIRSDFGFSVSLLPAGQGAVEGAAAGLQADPAAAGRATLAGAAVAGTADVQPASVLGVVHKRQSVPHEGHRRLEETGHLARKRRKRRLRRRFDAGRNGVIARYIGWRDSRERWLDLPRRLRRGKLRRLCGVGHVEAAEGRVADRADGRLRRLGRRTPRHDDGHIR